ncbi:MAG: hypothetical protein U0892_12300 [Pirellulales bacterium]
MNTGMGCIQGRASLHELDHVKPEHWPNDLADASVKIESLAGELPKATSTEEAERIKHQLIDLTNQTPVIAADTDLTEEQWLRIYTRCESLKNQLIRSSQAIDAARPDIAELCRQLQASHALLEEQTQRNEVAASESTES